MIVSKSRPSFSERPNGPRTFHTSDAARYVLHRHVRIGSFNRSPAGDREVVDIRPQVLPPDTLCLPLRVFGFLTLAVRGEVPTVPDLRGARLAAILQSVAAEVADGRQHVEARFSALMARFDERMLEQRGERVGRVERVVGGVAGHGVGRRRRPTADEHGQTTQDLLRRRFKLLVAPRDHVLQRTVALDRAIVSTAEETKLLVDLRREVTQREDVEARRGQLDGEGDAVELLANMIDVARGDLGVVELGLHGARPLDKQPCGLRGLAIGVSGGQRGERDRDVVIDAEIHP